MLLRDKFRSLYSKFLSCESSWKNTKNHLLLNESQGLSDTDIDNCCTNFNLVSGKVSQDVSDSSKSLLRGSLSYDPEHSTYFKFGEYIGNGSAINRMALGLKVLSESEDFSFPTVLLIARSDYGISGLFRVAADGSSYIFSEDGIVLFPFLLESGERILYGRCTVVPSINQGVTRVKTYIKAYLDGTNIVLDFSQSQVSDNRTPISVGEPVLNELNVKYEYVAIYGGIV